MQSVEWIENVLGQKSDLIMFEPNCVIVLIAPEIAIKSEVVRSFMIARLKKNISFYLKYANLETKDISYTSGRLIIPSKKPQEIVSLLKTCFGIHSLFLSEVISFVSLEDLAKKVLPLCENKFSNETFAVRGKSFSKLFSSKDLEIALGDSVTEKYPKLIVKLKDPKKELFCLVVKDKAFVYFDAISGAGGMPVSVQGKAAILCNKNTNKNDLILIAKSLMKCGASIILASDDEPKISLSELQMYNCFIQIKSIPISLAKSYSIDGGVRAFFSCARTTKEVDIDSELMGEKVFAPLIF